MREIKKILALFLAVAICLSLLCGCAPQAEPVSEPTPEPTPEATPEPTPVPTPEHTPESTPEATPEYIYPGPDLEAGERVDDEFFADALFVGNSLVLGLWAFGGLESAHFCAATSANVLNVFNMKNEAGWESQYAPSILNDISSHEFGKAYVLLGINEISFEVEDFVDMYAMVLDKIEELNPGIEIYIMGLTPVTQWKDAAGYPFTMERILSYNEGLRNLAAERECWYVDLMEAMAGEDGFLVDAESTDGVHFVKEKYPDWSEYLRTHYAPEKTD